MHYNDYVVNEGFDAENQTDKDTDTSEYESSDTSDEEQVL